MSNIQMTPKQAAMLQKQREEKALAMRAAEKEMLESTMFPKGYITNFFDLALPRALAFKTVVTMDCEWPTFKSLLEYNPGDQLNLMQMAKALNAIENSTPEQLRMTAEGYVCTQDDIHAMMEQWNAIIKPLREAIQQKYK